MRQVLGPDGKGTGRVAFHVPRMLIFLGKWLRHAGGYPKYEVRLFLRDRCRFIDFGHGQRERVSGPVGHLVQPLLHFHFSHGLAEWLRKHNRYSDVEAEQAVTVRAAGHVPLREAIFHRDPSVRRRALKECGYFLPFRAAWRFLYAYVYAAGWLDAKEGFHYCALVAMYEYWVQLKIRERERAWKGRTQQIADQLTGDDADAALTPTLPGEGPAATAAVDVMIPTFNEAAHIARTVRNARSLGGSVFVLDSFSTDGTQDLARAAGAMVVEHRFVNYADQKNWGLDNLPFTAEWVFILDADERLTPPLRRAIGQVVRRPGGPDGYYVNRALVFMGHNVRHGGLYPSWNLRLFRRGKARYEERAVHEHMVCNGTTDYLPGEMVHIRTESMHQYIAKHIGYADLESSEWVNLKLGRSTSGPPSKLFKSHLRLRSWIRREIWPRAPLRPLWRFLHMYVVRLGVLDGLAGWHLARLMASYEYTIGLLHEDKLLRERFGNAQMSPDERDRKLAARVARAGKWWRVSAKPSAAMRAS
jgi:hypothetical protein